MEATINRAAVARNVKPHNYDNRHHTPIVTFTRTVAAMRDEATGWLVVHAEYSAKGHTNACVEVFDQNGDEVWDASVTEAEFDSQAVDALVAAYAAVAEDCGWDCDMAHVATMIEEGYVQ